MDESLLQNSSLPQIGSPNAEIASQTVNQASESTLFDELGKIKQCIDRGIVTPLQGQDLMNHAVNKAYNMVIQRGGVVSQSNPVEEFTAQNPAFFNTEGRNAVLEYLRNSGVGRDELSQIATLIELVENTAIEGYLKKKEYEQSLNNKNEEAKQRLTSNAQNSVLKSSPVGTFTRDQIGRMSGTEFAQNEKAIMEQLKKGLIK